MTETLGGRRALSTPRVFVIARLGIGKLKVSKFVTAKPKQSYKTAMLIQKQPGGWVYIMCSLNHSTLYVGVTSNIASRVYEHKQKVYPAGFSSRYNCIKLVYYRRFELIVEAIAEEKRIKGGSRRKKEDLINAINPEWKDLYEDIKYL